MKNTNFKPIILFMMLFILSSCHFVADSDSPTNRFSFLCGLWDGAVIIWSIALNVLFDVGVIAHQPDFAYRLGFAIGALGLSWNFGLFAGIVSVVLYFTPF